MKKFFFLPLLLLSVMAFSQEKFEPKELRGAEANAVWNGAEHIWLKQANTVPAFIQFRAETAPDEETFFLVLRKTFNLSAAYSFRLLATEPDQLGWQHKRFQLQLNGVPVNGGVFILHELNDRVYKYNGYLFKNIPLRTTPSLAEADALNFALGNINAQTYKWQLPEEESFIKIESGDPDATFYPKGELEILQIGKNESNNFKLAWKFDVYAHKPMSRTYVYVDAQTGEVLKKTDRIHEANTNGTATTVYRGNRTIVADSYTGGYRLRETTRGLGIRTYNMLKGTNYGNAVDFVDANNVWNNVNANLDQYAGDAHWGAEMTYDFYTTMGRNSIDNAGFALYLYMHYNTNYVNAFWDGTRMTFGDGNTTYDPLVSLDITGHEISHGLTERTSNLDYQDESGALNESFSDIFGTAVEWHADSTVANWLVGEDIGAPFRSMSNPNTYGDPDTYNGTNWYTGTGDNGGVHTNSGVQNHWYYRLAQGGAGTNDIGSVYNVTGIGRNKATRIAWRNDVVYLTSTSDYADARFYAIQSANDLYGVCSPEAISTTKAWYAVGVGPDFVNGADAQFTASPVSGCTVPFTVNFANTSINATSYAWTFGDGGTSSALNPSYTYNALGTYTVKLVISGACGVDSLLRTNYVSVSTSNPCVVIMPVTGTYQTQTACTGTVYDNGGAAANYTDNTNSVVTIAPVGASQVRLHFTQFNMENTYDFVYVYDGPTTASPVIGSFTGTTIPADVVSSGSSVTIRQYTDPGVVAAGFTIQWTCINPNSPPTANFKADVTQSCSGGIKFTDLTVGGPNAWLWNFGDGTTSTVQHPTHNYIANGTYTVSLQATNNFGNNTSTKTNYITITKPAGPAAAGQSNCGPQAFTLSAAGSNAVTWFDSLGNVVSGTNPFTTPVLNNTTTYFVQDTQPQPIYHVGSLSNTIGTGSNYNATQSRALRFRVFKKSKLVSVLVYAQGDGYRTVQQRDSLGGVIANKTVFIPNGSSRITLNLDLLPGTYELGLRDTMNLYRNSTGAVYPYNDANGIVSIFGNNAANSATYYYYFYDWEVKESDCISRRVPVVATVKPALTATSTSSNVLCSGANNGNAGIVLTGGTPSFTYLWNTNATTASLSNLSPGTYTVTATDATGCSASATQTITQPGPLAYSTTITQVLCNGAATGAIDLGVSGGTSGYTYNWGGGIVAQDRVGVPAGSYAVTITDANLCTASASATVTQPAALNIIATPTGVLCNGGNTGSVALAVTGGVSNYTYNWTGGVTTQNLTNVAAGTYAVTVTDANACSSTASATVAQLNGLAPSATITNVLCNGQNTGSIDLSVSGGLPGYTYAWAGGTTSQDRSSLAAGVYPVTITDANACSTTLAFSVSQPAAIASAASVTNVLCNGGNTGAIDLNVTGGSPAYTYAWTGGASTQDLSGVAAGTYIVTITDNNGCTSTTNATVSAPQALNATAGATNVLCNGGSTGSVNLSVTGGTTSYTYSWSGGATTQSISGVAAGTYFATVADANQCTTVASVTVTEPTAISATTTVSNVLCNGGNTGAVVLNANGGTAGYSYTWSGNETSQNLNVVAAGIYAVTVTDANGCTATASAAVTQPASIVISALATDVACHGANTGSINLNAAGGTGALTYTWTGGLVGQNITGLSAGIYAVTGTDVNGCTATGTATVNEASAIIVNTTAVNAGCGQNNGSVLASATGGTPGYTYVWASGETTTSVTGLGAGNYELTITDNVGCSATGAAIVNNTGSLTAAGSAVNVNCAGGADGSAAVNVTSGTQPYTYAWSNGATASAIDNVAAGNYTATVTDAAGCITIVSQSVTEPVALNVSAFATQATCGAANGTAVVTASGGTQGYAYAWSNSGSGANLANLAAGTYAVTVTDANNCTAENSVLVTSATSIVATLAATNATCNNTADGTASISITSAQQPITYLWSNGETTSSLSGLVAGSYLVTITDGNNCPDIQQVTITSPTAIAVTFNAQAPLCNGGNDGSITATATGGNSGYTFTWSNTSSGNILDNVAAGNYTVTVLDANNCNTTAQFDLTEPLALSVTAATTDVACNGNQNGSAVVTVTGGTSGYTYEWCNGSVVSSVQNMGAGDCSVTVTDNNGCTISSLVTINEPAPVLFATSTTNANIGANDGSVQVTNPTGGSAPYTFVWNTGDTTQNLLNIQAGTYSVTVSDNNGCTETANVIVQENPSGIDAIGIDVSVSVFPNPAYNEVTVSIGEWQKNMQISIKNVLGQTITERVVTGNQTKMDLSLFAAGVYMLEINTGEKKIVKEIVISR